MRKLFQRRVRNLLEHVARGLSAPEDVDWELLEVQILFTEALTGRSPSEVLAALLAHPQILDLTLSSVVRTLVLKEDGRTLDFTLEEAREDLSDERLELMTRLQYLTAAWSRRGTSVNRPAFNNSTAAGRLIWVAQEELAVEALSTGVRELRIAVDALRRNHVTGWTLKRTPELVLTHLRGEEDETLEVFWTLVDDAGIPVPDFERFLHLLEPARQLTR